MGKAAKLGPFARTDLCALVKGLLDKFMTHFWLGSSLGRTLGTAMPIGRGEGLAARELVLLVAWGHWSGKSPAGRPC